MMTFCPSGESAEKAHAGNCHGLALAALDVVKNTWGRPVAQWPYRSVSGGREGAASDEFVAAGQIAHIGAVLIHIAGACGDGPWSASSTKTTRVEKSLLAGDAGNTRRERVRTCGRWRCPVTIDCPPPARPSSRRTDGNPSEAPVAAALRASVSTELAR